MPLSSLDSSTSRRAPRQARASATVERISAAAIQVLIDEGVENLTNARVADRAGVAVGTMYQYFPHIKALMYALVEQHLSLDADGFEAACESLEGAPLTKMSEGIAYAFVENKLRQPQVWRALYRLMADLDTDEIGAQITKRLHRSSKKLLSSVPDTVIDEVSDVASLLLTAMNGIMRSQLERDLNSRDMGKLRKQLTRLCHGYLRESIRT